MTKQPIRDQKQKSKKNRVKPKRVDGENSLKAQKAITDEEMINLRILINHIIRRQKP